MNIENTSETVAEANKRFYDQIADIYDNVDSRRDPNLDHSWIERIVYSFKQTLKKRFPEDERMSFMDAGTGSAFLAYRAERFFEDITLLDISQKMLDKIDMPQAKKIVGDCSHIPLPDESFHFIGGFATLHHLYNPVEFFQESFRLLKKGGILYTDHDIEARFVSFMGLPLKVWRFFFDHGKKYLKLSPESKAEDYFLSEYHGGSGLNADKMKKELLTIGFSDVKIEYHWNGSGGPEKILDTLKIKALLSRKGFAPNMRLIVTK